MQFTIFDFIVWMAIYLNYFVVAKILIRDKSFCIKECVYVTIASLIKAVLAIISINIFYTGITISALIIPFACMFYFNKIKHYPLVKSFALLFFPMIIIAMSDVVTMTLVNFFFPYFFTSIPNFPLLIGFSFNNFLYFSPYIFFTLILSAVTTYLLVTVTKKQRKLINQSVKVQKFLAFVSLLTIAITITVTYTWRYLGSAIESLAVNTIPLLIVAVATFVCIVFYTVSLHMRVALKQKEAEQEAMKYYTEQIEQQQIVVQQFKHDSKNILLSIEGYLEANDITGLKDYFHTKIKTTTNEAIQDDFNLHRLNKIKVPEIRATIMGKLVAAQSAGINTTLEVEEKIDHISMDSISLVRILGILLDNAIEALNELQTGTLSVACFKQADAVVLIVQNTCKEDLPPLSQLKQAGFSTKGTGRGLGLSNLSKFVGEHPNAVLQTNISEGNFTQKLTIESVVTYQYYFNNIKPKPQKL